MTGNDYNITQPAVSVNLTTPKNTFIGLPLKSIEKSLTDAAHEGLQAVGKTIDDIINGIGGFFMHAKNDMVAAADAMGMEINIAMISLLSGLEALASFDEKRFLGWLEGSIKAMENINSAFDSTITKFGYDIPTQSYQNNIQAIGLPAENESDMLIAISAWKTEEGL